MLEGYTRTQPEMRPASPPFSVVKAVPIRSSEMLHQTTLPLLFTEDQAGRVSWQFEAAVYAKSYRAKYSSASIESDIKVIARLYDFYQVFCEGKPLPEGGIDSLICAYLSWRRSGTLREGVSLLA
jgi:hypothetical protein